jgi:hypothetical protein
VSETPVQFLDDRNFRQLLRKMVQERGQAVAFEENWKGELEVSAYGWMDTDVFHHIRGMGEERGCSWVIEDEAVLTEESYFVAGDTDTDGTYEAGINIHPARCACGKYRDMHLRYADSLGNILRYLLSNDGGGISI